MSRFAKVCSVGAMVLAAGFATDVARAQDQFSHLPSSLKLTGVVRDFRERSVSGGHPDFEKQPTGGFGQYGEMVQDTLDADGKPQFRSTGKKLASQWRDAAGRNMMAPRPYISAKQGDQAGSYNSSSGALTTAANLAQWFRDTPNVNMSRQLQLTLVRQANTNIYTFNDRTDATFANRGGFFPINGELFGNSAGNDRNFHFTFELSTEFVFNRGAGQVFSFTGDDDVWVFIDGKLVIDIGGVHGAVNQSIELDRLNWLQSGQSYSLKFFFAERHRTQSNFRIDTTIALRSVEPPTTTAMYD